MEKKLSRLEAQYVSIKLFERFCDSIFCSVPSIQRHLNYFDVSVHVKGLEDYQCLCDKLNLEFPDYHINSFYLDKSKEYCVYITIDFDYGE